MINKAEKLVLWFNDINKTEVALVGGKSASLGELTSRTHVPVPYGFATTAQAYRLFVEETGLGQKIAELLEGLTDVEDSQQLRTISAGIRAVIMNAAMPEIIAADIRSAYHELALKVGEESPFVAVPTHNSSPVPRVNEVMPVF